jgi:hypothetical protein
MYLIEEQSSNLLLVFASAVILGFAPQRDPWSYICSFQDHLCVLKCCLLFEERRDLTTVVDYVTLYSKMVVTGLVRPGQDPVTGSYKQGNISMGSTKVGVFVE